MIKYEHDKFVDNVWQAKHTKNSFFLKVGFVLVFTCLCVVCFCTGLFIIVPLILTCLHCLQHSYLEHLFNLYIIIDSCITSKQWLLTTFDTISQYVNAMDFGAGGPGSEIHVRCHIILKKCPLSLYVKDNTRSQNRVLFSLRPLRCSFVWHSEITNKSDCKSSYKTETSMN